VALPDIEEGIYLNSPDTGIWETSKLALKASIGALKVKKN